MASISKKICLVGDFAVGKTSLVARYVNNVFSEKYQTTIGVKIDTKTVTLPQGSIKFVLWDIAGRDRFSTTDRLYLRGAAGYLLVADGTRHDTLSTAIQLKKAADQQLSSPTSILLINKLDLVDAWEISDNELQSLTENGLQLMKSSAKLGDNVEQAFRWLAAELLS